LARKHQFAAFIADEALLVVWDDDVHNLIKRAKFIEDELMELVWSTEGAEDEEGKPPEKKGPGVVDVEFDPETGLPLPENRPTNLQNTVLVSITIVIIEVMLGAGFREIAIEVAIDHNWFRVCFLFLTPLQVFFTLVSYRLYVCTLSSMLILVSSSLKSSSVVPPRWSVRSPKSHQTHASTLHYCHDA